MKNNFIFDKQITDVHSCQKGNANLCSCVCITVSRYFLHFAKHQADVKTDIRGVFKSPCLIYIRFIFDKTLPSGMFIDIGISLQ